MKNPRPPKAPKAPFDRKLALTSFLIGLFLTVITAWSVTAVIRALATSLLKTATDEALIDLLTPVQYLRFRISLLPTAFGAFLVSLPVFRIARSRSIRGRIGWIILILFMLIAIWIISLLTLRVGWASLFKIILTLLRTLFNLA